MAQAIRRCLEQWLVDQKPDRRAEELALLAAEMCRQKARRPDDTAALLAGPIGKELTESLTASRGRLIIAGIPRRPEPEFLVQMADALSRLPDHDTADAKELWWTYCRIKSRYHRHLIQEPGTEGLDYFQTIFYRKKRVQDLVSSKDLFKTFLRDPHGIRAHLAPVPWVRGLELRTSPEAVDVDNLVRLAERAAALREPERLDISVVVHFIKRGEPRKSLEKVFQELRIQLNQLYELLAIQEPLRRHLFFRGLDVAGSEVQQPNWLYLPLFVEFRERWRERFVTRLPGYTFHAGEDFRHLPQGLRHIGEVIEFFPWKEGDRLGHGLALGLDPAAWLERHPIRVTEVEARLFDLIWEWHLYVHNGVRYKPQLLSWMQDEIMRLGAKLLGRAANAMSDIRRWWLFYRGLFCPRLVMEQLGWPVSWAGIDEHEPAVAEEIRRETVVQRALRTYLRRYHHLRPGPVTWKPVFPRSDEIDRIAAIQEYLIGEIGKRHIAVEVCPTSNLLIKGLQSFLEHPLLKLRDRIPILINTDNPATFSTTLNNEFALAYHTMGDAGLTARERLGVLRELIENNRRYEFGLIQ